MATNYYTIRKNIIQEIRECAINKRDIPEDLQELFITIYKSFLNEFKLSVAKKLNGYFKPKKLAEILQLKKELIPLRRTQNLFITKRFNVKDVVLYIMAIFSMFLTLVV